MHGVLEGLEEALWLEQFQSKEKVCADTARERGSVLLAASNRNLTEVGL